MRGFSSRPFVGVGLFSAFTAFTQAADASKLITFDAPNASVTLPTAITALGNVVGYYADADAPFPYLGFIRSPSGAITTFAAPAPDLGIPVDTIVYGTNLAGQIVGTVAARDAYLAHGFFREPNGVLTLFDAAPGALTTFPYAINLVGSIAGVYTDAQFATHGFLRTPRGAITTFDVPGFLTGNVELTALDEVIGTYGEANQLQHGFVRKPNGTLVTFDVPGAVPSGCGHCVGMLVTAANAFGRTVGYFNNDDSIAVHGFLRTPTGAISTFDVSGATETMPTALNLQGEIAGEFVDPGHVTHGFFIGTGGAVTTFDMNVPNIDIRVTGVNLGGTIVGHYDDPSGHAHGFLRTQ